MMQKLTNSVYVEFNPPVKRTKSMVGQLIETIQIMITIKTWSLL